MTRFEGNFKFIIMMTAFLVLAVIAQGQQSRQDSVIDNQDKVIALQRIDQYNLCTAREGLAQAHNKLVGFDIKNVSDMQSLNAESKKNEIIMFTSILIKPNPCHK